MKLDTSKAREILSRHPECYGYNIESERPFISGPTLEAVQALSGELRAHYSIGGPNVTRGGSFLIWLLPFIATEDASLFDAVSRSPLFRRAA
jgi:hypothetical protein